MSKPKIELKNIKHFAEMSEETHCYTATIYVDGKKFATVKNAGHGGCDMVHPFKGSYQAVKDLEDRIKETYPRHEDPDLGLTLEPSLEIICGDLVNDFLVKKDFKKTMRRIVYYIEGIDGLFQLPAKYKPTSQIIQQIKARASWAKDAVFLADLPEDEAFEVFKQKG